MEGEASQQPAKIARSASPVTTIASVMSSHYSTRRHQSRASLTTQEAIKQSFFSCSTENVLASLESSILPPLPIVDPSGLAHPRKTELRFVFFIVRLAPSREKRKTATTTH
ncbi:hypothetical protein L596_020102 [Steinernema carpocapsae]|uniref:Uncharacterized protein n=1 Tax=Steinernema carpocapsae TaxID=34508 RepID=A0A4U5MSL1_STECR|nr:hypothetical protein L596_020102 [Steinernema carpocapsae]